MAGRSVEELEAGGTRWVPRGSPGLSRNFFAEEKNRQLVEEVAPSGVDLHGQREEEEIFEA